MKLYVMRHGQTDWNVLNKIQGVTDIALNDTGKEQANKAKEEFNKYNIDIIISSPLKRARKTAELVNSDRNIPIMFNDKIIERSFGKIEGVNPDELDLFKEKHRTWEYFWDYNANTNQYDIEPVSEICDRVWEALDEIKTKYHDKNVLLVTHGGTARVINAYFKGIGEDGILKRVGYKNCEIREYEF